MSILQIIPHKYDNNNNSGSTNNETDACFAQPKKKIPFCLPKVPQETDTKIEKQLSHTGVGSLIKTFQMRFNLCNKNVC